MKTVRAAVLGFSTMSLAAPHGAFAACERIGSLVCGGGGAGIASGAELQVSRGGSFGPLPSGSSLRNGDRVLVGPAGATLSLGATCHAPVDAGSLVSLLAVGDQTCATVTSQALDGMTAQVPDAPVAPAADAGGVSPLAVAGVAAAAAVGVGVALGARGNDGRNGTPTISAQ